MYYDVCFAEKQLIKFMDNLVPRVLSYPPYGASERERETLENAGHVSPRIWEITNKRSGEGQVSVRFVYTERRQVSAAMRLCT